MAHIKFYLRANKIDKELGILCHYKLDGAKVLERKSYKIRIPFKHWDKVQGRVKRTHLESEQVNGLIDHVMRSFEQEEKLGSLLPDEQSVIKLFEEEINRKLNQKNIAAGSRSKYETILNNFKEAFIRLYGSDYVPFKNFRNIKNIERLKEEIRISRRNGEVKSNKALRTYMSTFASVIKRWNTISGTQNPINTLPFTADIKVEKPQKIKVPEPIQIQNIIDYQPKGKRGAEAERLAQTIFIFQYYCSGIRFQDAILLTNKTYRSGSLFIPTRKIDDTTIVDVNYQMLKALVIYYPELVHEVNQSTNLSELKLPVKTIANLVQAEFHKPITKWTVDDLIDLEIGLKDKTDEYSELVIEKLFDIRVKLQRLVANRFFERLSEGEEHFIFPYLKVKDFKGTMYNFKNFNKTHETIIQRCRAKHNNALKRISRDSGIMGLSGHTPRHSVARHMIEAGFTTPQIQSTLNHASEKTTRIYLDSRHYNLETKQAARKFYEKIEQ